jgi:hypothetical protein
MDYLAGVGVLVLDTLLLGIGWVGKARLKRWEAYMELFLKREKALRVLLSEVYDYGKTHFRQQAL